MANELKLPPLPTPENEADSDGCTYACPEGFSADQMREYARAAVEGDRAASPVTESRGEAVAIYHGNGIIDCGEHGHHNLELLKMIPAGAKLYTAAPALSGDIAEFCELIDDYQCAQKDGSIDDRANARLALMNAYRAALLLKSVK